MTQDTRTELFNLAKIAQQKIIKRNKKATKKRPYSSRLIIGSNNKGSPTQVNGKKAEDQALTHLCNNGLLLLERNLLYKTGEIDIALQDGKILVFVEVRLRNNSNYGNGLDSINKQKKLKIIRTAQYYLPYLAAKYFHNEIPLCRFDVVSINKNEISWVKYAFEVVSN